MTAIIYAPLEAVLWPLMNKFYRAHQSSMKAVRDAQLWVARQEEIIAGLCLRPMAHGYWLTGLFVAPELRGQGVAGALVSRLLTTGAGQVDAMEPATHASCGMDFSSLKLSLQAG